MKASSLTAHKAPITIEWFGEHAKCVVLPGRLTTALLDEVDAAERNGQASDLVLKAVCDIVAEWDIVDDDDTPWPVDVEHARRLPLGLIRQIVEKTRESTGEQGKGLRAG